MKKLSALLIALFAVVGLSACATNGGQTGTGDTPTGAANDHLVVVVGGLPVSMDPHASNDMFTSYFSHQIYDTLVRLDPDDLSNVQPLLAVSWDMPDTQTLDMQLRDDVYFHNGERLTASDVRFSLLRAKNSPHVGFILGMIDDVIVHDDLNFTITLVEPFTPILNHLGHFGTSILHEATVTAAGDAFHNNPVGTGAFQFESIVLGDRIELTRFDNFWGPAPAFEGMTWRAMPEATNRLIEVETGHAQVAIIIDPNDVARAEASDSVAMHRRQSLQALYLGLNTQIEPFDDVLVRQAINYALDIETISRVVYEGTGTPATGAVTGIVWGAYPQAPFPHDIERARDLMVQAGLEDGFSTVLWYNTEDQQAGDMANLIQNQLMDIGINVSLESLEWSTFLERTAVGDQEMFMLSWFTVTGDADYGLFDTQHSSGFGAGNRTFFSTPELDALLEEGRTNPDPARRMEVYREAQRIIHSESPRIYIHHAEELHATSPNLRNVILHPDGRIDLWSVYFAN